MGKINTFVRKNIFIISYIIAGLLTLISYENIRTLFVTQEPNVYGTVARSGTGSITVNFILLFMFASGMCPILVHWMHGPRWLGFLLSALVILVLIYFFQSIGMRTIFQNIKTK